MKTCQFCVYYSHSEYLVCTLYPHGKNANSCSDYQLNPDYKEQWSPEGYYYYNGELCKNPEPKSTEERFRLLNNHPLFTDKCPECGYEFDQNNPPPVYWDCPECDWIDDSV